MNGYAHLLKDIFIFKKIIELIVKSLEIPKKAYSKTILKLLSSLAFLKKENTKIENSKDREFDIGIFSLRNREDILYYKQSNILYIYISGLINYFLRLLEEFEFSLSKFVNDNPHYSKIYSSLLKTTNEVRLRWIDFLLEVLYNKHAIGNNEKLVVYLKSGRISTNGKPYSKKKLKEFFSKMLQDIEYILNTERQIYINILKEKTFVAGTTPGRHGVSVVNF